MRRRIAALLALSAAFPAAALDGDALRHYAAGEQARANDAPQMAEGHFGKALRLLEAAGGAESEDAAHLLAEMAASALRQGDSGRARRHLRRALAITARVVGRDHPHYRARAKRLAALGETAPRLVPDGMRRD